MSRCPSSLVLQGDWFGCDTPSPHVGWAHTNKEAEAIWWDPGTPDIGNSLTNTNNRLGKNDTDEPRERAS